MRDEFMNWSTCSATGVKLLRFRQDLNGEKCKYFCPLHQGSGLVLFYHW